jgi:glycosyltransferase involved in cell wall biosynthesis
MTRVIDAQRAGVTSEDAMVGIADQATPPIGGEIAPVDSLPISGVRRPWPWRMAFVHDYLTQYGGAERVLEVLHALDPSAPVFTSIVDPRALPAPFASWDLRPSALNRVPGAARLHRGLLPLYPRMFRDLAPQLAAFDVVLADSSAWAHHAGTAPDTTLVCYCHSPARFLYGDRDYLEPARMPPGVDQAMTVLFAALRRADRQAATRVDRFVANSRNVAARIRRVYGRDVAVVYPPVDVARFAPAGADEDPAPWFLVVSRLVPHKRIDLAVDACTRCALPLKIIGEGRAAIALQRRAGPTVEFLGRLDDAAVADHLRRCRALILPGVEDFGLTAVEAQAAGRPVIAYRAGGAVESVVPWETGVFFDQPTPEALLRAIELFEARRWEPWRARGNAARFSAARFLHEMTAEVEAAVAAKARRRRTGRTGILTGR